MSSSFALSVLWNIQGLHGQASGHGTARHPAKIAAEQSSDSRSASPIHFENVIQNSKIKFTLKNSVSPQRYTFETMVGGVALFDYDNDGLLDIYFTNGAAIPSTGEVESFVLESVIPQ
ncbi:MAG TPA: hypothetical protein VGS27_09605 [Candidatus Sulfotelmatobacter sp.]|nr:hypothetical protein [Candidatus Sulfotelmatobacter sp.]